MPSSAALLALTALTHLRYVVRGRPNRPATCLLENFLVGALGEGRVARMIV